MTSRSQVTFWMIPLTIAVVTTLGACTAPTPPEPHGSHTGGKIGSHDDYFHDPADPIPAAGEVHGIGTVIQHGNAAPQLCLGPVAESYPPQCDGPEVDGWDWNAIDGHETSGSTTWGAYAVTGSWDGERFAITRAPIMLALYDTVRIDDPYLDPARSGSTSDERLQAIQTALDESLSYRPLSSHIENGYLFVSYIYDDGRRQRYLNEVYGQDVVVVRPALHDVSS